MSSSSSSSDQFFENFDILPSAPADHHYLTTEHQTCSALTKAINQEWKILKDGLPTDDSIFVRVYESSTHLMRAAIVGPHGTPYSDGLFFFDIFFPPNYPISPPCVYFHSHGLSVNPNLYPNGYVCLSLLNTWTGSKDEMWVNGKSSILQLLVSIQGLVLNDEPYYNEPYRLPFFANRASQYYSAIVFKQTCKLMIATLKNRPKDRVFESFVARHFRDKAYDILMINCRSRMMNSRADEKLLFNSLALTFEANGTNCREFFDQMQKEEELIKTRAAHSSTDFGCLTLAKSLVTLSLDFFRSLADI